MIVSNNEAVAAGIAAATTMDFLVPGSVVGGIINAAIPHLTDTGQPVQCGQLAGRPVGENCDCGHIIGIHRKRPNGEVVCDPCQIEADQTPLASLAVTRLDGLLNVVLDMERRLTERIDESLSSIDITVGRSRDRLIEKMNGVVEAVEGNISIALPAQELVTGPTDYEVWRDACTLANNEATSNPDGWTDADVLGRARWWQRQLARTEPPAEQSPSCDPGDCDPAWTPHEEGCIYHPEATVQTGLDDEGIPYRRVVPTEQSGHSDKINDD